MVLGGTSFFCQEQLHMEERSIVMEKMACFRCSASTSLNWGEGYFYFSFYSVQDCGNMAD